MKVYLVEPNMSNENPETGEIFNGVVIKQLMEYGVDFCSINTKNITRVINDIYDESLVIVYNEHALNTKCDDVQRFLEKAVTMNLDIWPVAIDRSTRIPMGIISNKQSYDVWEQLRCRDLDENYITTIAKIFSRKIIARVYPTCYSESGEIFLSHRRIDGEEITAKIYDKMIVQAKESTPFRDVINVKVGEDAQAVIDENMENCDVFVFIHTHESAESGWILKELRYALLRQIPILWIQIDNAEIGKLGVVPSENPHMVLGKEEFSSENKIVEIVDEILQKSFDLIMERSDRVIEYISPIEQLFGEKLERVDHSKMLYHVSVERNGYHYPQRSIEQYFQIFGRTPVMKDAEELKKYINEKEIDSVAILTNRIVSYKNKENISFDAIEDFYYHWNRYLYKSRKEVGNMEIILSGAFPDGDEIYKQSLTDALVLFSKAIIKNGYKLTFGAHPTFQELFFEVAKEIAPIDHYSRVNMYISNFFFDDNPEKELEFSKNCSLFKTDKKESRELSLTEMRSKMIKRDDVKALVCLGGKIKENKSEEGVREEILLARQHDIPVFIVGSVGGCSSVVAMEYNKIGWKELNNASDELNQEFFNGIDYFKMAQEMISFLNE